MWIHEKMRVATFIKRTLDIVLSLAMLIAFSPFLALIALVVKLDSPGPVIFRQQRAGLCGDPFTVYKFRSMVVNADRDGPVTRLIDPRVTRVGRFLRLTSLDELPQLVNVLRGEMSLVGPRPLLPNSIEPDESWRQTVRPGCTSLPIVSGRQSLDWDERMRLDRWYVENWSLWLDLRILFKTILIAVSRKNVYNEQGQMVPRLGHSLLDSSDKERTQ